MSILVNRMNRRRFLITSAAITCANRSALGDTQESNVKIERIEVYPVRYPLTGIFKKFISKSQGRSALIVKITADNGGLVGVRVCRALDGATKHLRRATWCSAIISDRH